MNARSFTELKKEVGIDAWGIECGKEEAVRAMTTLCGKGHGPLYRWTPRQSIGRHWSLHGHHMPAGSLDRTKFRVCPRCIIEDIETSGATGPFQRADWLVTFLRTCPLHAIPLIWCRPPKTIFQPYDFTRTVLSSVAELEQSIDPTGIPATRPFETFVTERLGGRRSKAPWLDEMPLHVAATLCEVSGAVAFAGHAVKRTLLSSSEAREAAEVGYAACREGPTGLSRLMKDVHSARAGKGVWGARASIGEIYPLLDSNRNDPDWSAPLNVVRGFLLDNVPFDEGDVLFGVPVERRRVHTIRSAVRASGTHSRTMRKLLVRSSLISENDLTARDHHVTLPARDVEHMLHALRSSLTTPQVMDLIGIPRLHLAHLVRSRAIGSLTMSVGVAWAKHRFDVDEVDRFMAALFEGAIEVETAVAPYCALKEARQHLNCSIAELLDLVVGGRARRKARMKGRVDYGALLVDHTELRPFVELKTPKSGLGRREASQFLGIRPQAVAMLIDRGVLGTFIERNTVNRCPTERIPQDDAERFRNEYVSLFELAGASGRHHRAVKADLTSAGLQPAFDPKLFFVTLYPRSAATSVLGLPTD